MTADHLVSALYPLSTPQREIWFDQMLHDGVPLYNIGGYVDLPGRIDPVMFEAHGGAGCGWPASAGFRGSLVRSGAAG
jgi:hypothetical protein